MPPNRIGVARNIFCELYCVPNTIRWVHGRTSLITLETLKEPAKHHFACQHCKVYTNRESQFYKICIERMKGSLDKLKQLCEKLVWSLFKLIKSFIESLSIWAHQMKWRNICMSYVFVSLCTIVSISMSIWTCRRHAKYTISTGLASVLSNILRLDWIGC